MKASFPTAFTAVLMGKSREGGEFEKGDGVKVSYGDGYLLGFESGEGLAQSVQVSMETLQAAADFDISKAPAYAQVNVRGDVKGFDDGWTFRPIEVRLAVASGGKGSGS
jgi:hypothetical protein